MLSIVTAATEYANAGDAVSGQHFLSVLVQSANSV